MISFFGAAKGLRMQFISSLSMQKLRRDNIQIPRLKSEADAAVDGGEAVGVFDLVGFGEDGDKNSQP